MLPSVAWHYEFLAEPVACPCCGRHARAWLFMRARGAWRPEEHWDNERREWCVLTHKDPWWLRWLLRYLHHSVRGYEHLRVRREEP